MGTAENMNRHTLVVRGPQRARLFERFRRLFDGRDDVVVVCDRRLRERRWPGGHVSPERRTHERRRRTAWVVPPD